MSRQGVYLIIAGRRLYVGSTAGKAGRSFDKRLEEHLKELAGGTHPNDALCQQYAQDGGKGWRMVKLAKVGSGNIEMARKVESIIIKALRRSLVNERG